MKEIELPRKQICACGEGCEDRSSVKWLGLLIVSCVSDEDADSIIDAVAQAARMGRRTALLDAQMAVMQAARAVADLDVINAPVRIVSETA
jgi:hypothetical protein